MCYSCAIERWWSIEENILSDNATEVDGGPEKWSIKTQALEMDVLVYISFSHPFFNVRLN